MHTNSIIELNNTAYQKTSLFSEPLLEKSTNSCVVKEMLTATELQKSFQWRTKRDYPLLRFDVEEAKIVKAELGDNATILVMGLVQDEDMEWVINNDRVFCFDKGRLTKQQNCKKMHKRQLYILR
jgi:alanine racemase